MELIQEFGAVLRDFIPVILVDKASVAEADSLLPLDQDLQLFLCFLIGPVELGGQYLGTGKYRLSSLSSSSRTSKSVPSSFI